MRNCWRKTGLLEGKAAAAARPRFGIVVLFVDETTSIARQLARGRIAQAHNQEVGIPLTS